MITPRPRAFLTAALLLALTSCGEVEPPSPQAVHQRASAVLSSLLLEMGQVGDQVRALKPLKELSTQLEAAGRALGVIPDEPDPPSPRHRAGTDPAPEPSESLADLVEETIPEIDAFMAEHLFNERLVESQEDGVTVFRLDGATLCPELIAPEVICEAIPKEPAPPCEEAVDEHALDVCQKVVDQVRITARSAGRQGVVLGVSAGSSGMVLELDLRPDAFTGTVRLSEGLTAAEELARLIGEELLLPEVMKGTVALSLTRNGPMDLTLKASVLESIEVSGVVEEGEVGLRLDKRDPLATIHYGGGQQVLTAAMNAPAIELLAPLIQAAGETVGQIKLVVQGIILQMTAAADGGMEVSNLSLGAGTSRLELDGERVVELSLQPGQEELNLFVAPWEERPVCTLTPELDLELTLRLARLADATALKMPEWALDDRYHLTIAPSGQVPPQIAPASRGAGEVGGLAVLSGELRLSSQKEPAELVVPQGSCVFPLDKDPPASAHPLLDALEVAPCP